MERAALLTPMDIHVIRRYVQTKYAPLPRSRQAEIVADAIRGALERRLPNLDPAMKARIAGELIRRCVVQERREVALDDVLEACASVGWDEAVDLESLERWAEDYSPPGSWSRERIESKLRGRREAAPPSGLADSAGALELTVAPEAAGFAPPSPAWHGGAGGAALGPGAPVRRRLPALGRHVAWLALALSLAAGGTVGLLAQQRTGGDAAPLHAAPYADPVPAKKKDVGMPDRLRYADVDAKAVKAYLRSRDSLLADEPYFGAIVASARKFDVNPLLLFAITGQEQGFVPRSGKQARQIVNNPFNVFHSWQDYNTDIADSSEIAARTIARRMVKRPEGHEPFEWLNLTYAEDPAWSEGVRLIFDKLANLSRSK
ncbi:hypothetical protein J19TS2_10290 [Cohnella xylanilytica]|nr:hypothetical protein [Cohnella xylanilytica]GIO11474.1 hypothetical protein J19TS2_10290 [Cohnella xylanilytica]